MAGATNDTVVVVSRRTARPDMDADLVNQTWLVGLDRAGKQRWRQDLGDDLANDLSGSVRVEAGLVLTHETRVPMGKHSALVARDPATGVVRWRAPSTGTDAVPPLRRSSSAVVGNTLLTAAYSGGVMAYDLKSGAVSNPLPGKGLGVIDGIVSDDRTVTIDLSGLLITFDRMV